MMISIQFCLLITICALAESSVSPSNDGKLPSDCGKSTARIIGGEVAKNSTWRWQAGLLFSGAQYIHFCGGSIINQRWILTAAHCTKDESGNTVIPANYTIILGANLIQLNVNDGLNFSAVSVIPHPKYNPTTVEYDIALIKLDQSIDFSKNKKKISPVCLTKNTYYNIGDNATVTGWGIAEDSWENTNNFPPQPMLKQIGIPIVSVATCKAAYADSTFLVTDSHICAGKYLGSTCQGDSGGPLVIKNGNRWYQYGAVSWGASFNGNIPCGLSPNAYSVFTDVSKYIDWIKETIACKNNNGCKD